MYEDGAHHGGCEVSGGDNIGAWEIVIGLVKIGLIHSPEIGLKGCGQGPGIIGCSYALVTSNSLDVFYKKIGFIFLFPISLCLHGVVVPSKKKPCIICGDRLCCPHLLNAAFLESHLIPTQRSVQFNLKHAA